jgi:hypothetical protein
MTSAEPADAGVVADADPARATATGEPAKATATGDPAAMTGRVGGATVAPAEATAVREATEPVTPVTGWRGWFSRPRRVDLLVLAVYALLAGWVFAHLLTAVNGHYLRDSNSDQRQMEWYFTWVAQAISHGHSPFLVTADNAPVGVNGMGNTMVLALSVPMIPVTLAFGAATSFTIVMVLGITATAWCWYWLFSRQVVASRLAAAIAGGLVAYSPTMVSHANGHVNMVVHFGVPLIIGLTLRLREPGHTVRRGVLLGLAAVVQFLIGAEVLLIAALGLGVYLLAYCLQRPAALRAGWRTTLGGLGVALAVALPLLAYPLWFQFAGPQHYAGLPFTRFLYADPMSYVSFATQSLAGGAGAPGRYAMGNLTEENGFSGWPLVVLTAGLVVCFRRSVLVRAAAITGAVFVVLSLGNRIFLRGHSTGVPGPWRLLAKLPLLENIIPARLSYVTIPMVALLVAVGTDKALALAPRARAVGVPLRTLWLGTLAVAIVPVFPLPLPATSRPPVPAFFTRGAWQRYVGDGGTVVPVPLTRSPFDTAADDWQIATDMRFRIAGGYFVGPWKADKYGPDGHGWFDAQPRPTDALLQKIEKAGVLPEITATDKADALADLRYWQADAIVMDPTTVKHPDELRSAIDQLIGVTGTLTGGIWLWQVTPLTH